MSIRRHACFHSNDYYHLRSEVAYAEVEIIHQREYQQQLITRHDKASTSGVRNEEDLEENLAENLEEDSDDDEDEIGPQPLGLVDGFDAVLRLRHPVAAELEVLAVHFSSVGEIVDDQHERELCDRLQAFFAARPGYVNQYTLDGQPLYLY